MGGIYIDCGTFSGSDKSGKPILFVLAGMHSIADPVVLPVLMRFIASVTVSLHSWSSLIVTEVSPDDAEALLPCLRRYRTQLEELLVPIRASEEAIQNDRKMFLAGKQEQYPCVLDLERAFEVSIVERVPTIISWD